ncbi:MAG: hypothetical protein ABF289_07085 [Clostridiales bacterium]
MCKSGIFKKLFLDFQSYQKKIGIGIGIGIGVGVDIDIDIDINIDRKNREKI